MSGNFIDGLTPIAFMAILLAGTICCSLLGFWAGNRLDYPKDATAEGSLMTSLAAMFGIVALVLSFSFSFALARYEQRWHLVVEEANDIGTFYRRASVLNEPQASALRSLLRVYTQDRLEYYAAENEPRLQEQAEAMTLALQNRIWKIVSDAARARPNAVTGLLMQVANSTIDLSAEQRAALRFRLTGPALVLILFVAGLGAFALGIGFGVSHWHNWLVTIFFAVLLSALVYTIIDLDSPQSGFVRINLTPLVELQHSMSSQP